MLEVPEITPTSKIDDRYTSRFKVLEDPFNEELWRSVLSCDHIFIYKYNRLRSSKFYYLISIIKNVSEQLSYNCLSKQDIIALSAVRCHCSFTEPEQQNSMIILLVVYF